MIIKELTLYTNELEREKKFYTQTLGFDFEENCSNMFSVKIGRTKLNFQQTEISYRYHYCFLIPANQLASAIKWLENRVTIIEIEKGRVIQRFESWNADSIYFYDGSGNIAEFIVRYDLKNESEEEFGLSSIISVNEMGLATKNVAKTNQQLTDGINSEFWKGNKLRFGTNGDQEGLFLLPNYEIKKEWFPTELKVTPAPFKSVILNKGKEYIVVYENEEIKITMKK